MSFCHLHLHTEYSLEDSLVRIEPLMQRVAELNMPAVALTDRNNLFAAIKFYRTALRYGIKPILGAEIDLELPLGREASARAVLLCQNAQGYRQLCELLSRRYQEGAPFVSRALLAEKNDGLIVLSGGLAGDLGQAALSGNHRLAEAALEYWMRYFKDRFYIEGSRTDRDHEDDYLNFVLEYAHQHKLPAVATNDVRFLSSDDFEAHEVRVCIKNQKRVNDPDRPRDYSKEQYLRDEAVMCEAFRDYPTALIENAQHIAQRCTCTLDLGRTLLPAYPTPDGVTMEDYLDQRTGEGLDRRLRRLEGSGQQAASVADYEARLKHELDVIHATGFSGYFVIVADFVEWARNNEVPVGPGRGSGAGSLVAYALGITGLDPLRYGLLFERFLNPDRVSPPDFDIDFCNQKRDLVIDYVRERYGDHSVAQIITYGTMAAKAAIRDVGRALGAPFAYCDRIARAVPLKLDITLQEAYQESEEFRALVSDPNDTTGEHLYQIARQLEGIMRNASRHAAGVVIAPGSLTDYTPLYFEPRQPEMAITQYDKDDIETIGLTKFDFLGLKTLTLLHRCLMTVNAWRVEQGEEALDLETLPLDDAETYRLLQQAKTTAVFQLESAGMRDLVQRLQPNRFDDLAVLLALYRPGPLNSGMDTQYIDNRRDPGKISYLHPDIKPALEDTYGVMLYQEQVMRIARDVAGYSLGESDLLRRAMGKKKPEEMAKQSERFQQGAVAHGLKAHEAERIFDQMKEFAEYGFNKSHSVAYAMLTYQTAWFKTHYPDAFMAAAMSSEMENTDKLAELCQEARALDLKLLGPDINTSDCHFTVPERGKIRYGLGALKGVGRGLAERLVDLRGERVFDSLEDLCRRLEARDITEKGLSTLIHAGALDSLADNRKAMAAAINEVRQQARRIQQDELAGQESLFMGASEEAPSTPASHQPVECEDYEPAMRLEHERVAMGFYFSAHPFLLYRRQVRQLVKQSLGQLIAGNPRHNRLYQVAGVVVTVTHPRNGEVSLITIEDDRNPLQLVTQERDYARGLQLGELIFADGKMQHSKYAKERGEPPRFHVQSFYTLEQMHQWAHQVRITLSEDSTRDTVDLLRALLQRYRGHCEVRVDWSGQEGRNSWMLGEEWKMAPNEEALQEIGRLAGVKSADILYERADA